MKLIKLIVIFLFISLFSQAQQFKDLSANVPFDTSFVKGVLPNGLTYYIKHNAVPRNRASYYLIQNVGSILENDDQSGLAHFLEHMAFNGTNSFPGKAMLNMLEKRGVQFGKDINAYTGRNETVYNLSRVPTNEDGLVDSCLLVLHDWCDGLALTDEDIDAERGVITEEARTRQNASARVSAKIANTIFNGSMYARRDPIGNMNVVNSFKYNSLRSFYKEWYRSDLQAIAIVGDVDVKEVEKKVIALFSQIPPIAHPRKRTLTVIPDNDKPMYVLATDKEYKLVTTEYKTRFVDVAKNTLQNRKNKYIEGFFNALAKARISEVLKKGDAPFLGANISIGGLERGYKTFNVSATSYPEKEKEAFEAVYTELQRMINFGFTETELERLKTSVLTAETNRYNKRKSIGSDNYCKLVKTSYLDSVAIPDAQFMYDFAQEIIPTITVKEVSSLASKYLTDKNVSFIVSGPEPPSSSYITEKQIEAIIAKVRHETLTPFVDKVSEQSTLLSAEPTAGEIVSEKDIDLFNACEWTLSNGAKVVYKYVKSPNAPVLLKAVSQGGNSVYDAADLCSVDALSSMVSGFGLGNFDGVELKKMLTGNSAATEFKIEPYDEYIAASALPRDVETMFQLMYMRFEEPRFDQAKYNNMMERFYYSVENTPKTPQSIVKDTINSILNAGNPRYTKFDKHYLDKVSFEKMKSIYQERFSNASDFTFYVVGDIQPEVFKPLLEKYIASIPGDGTTERWKDTGDFFPKGKNVHKISVPMDEPKATVLVKFKADAEHSRKAEVYNSILASILTIRYLEQIREKEGGTYGVSVKPTFTRIPKEQLGLEVRFDCDPKNVERLKSIVYREIDKVQKSVNPADLEKVLLNMRKNYQQVPKNGSYWMNVLTNYVEKGENITLPSHYIDIVNQATPKDIQQASKAFFQQADVLDMVFVPEGK